METKVVIGIGSNTPDRQLQMEKAIEWLGTWVSNISVSTIYTTSPEGDSAFNEYLNAVAAGYCNLSAEQIIARCKLYESDNGRTAELKKLDIVAIDLDLVIYGNLVLRPNDMNCHYFMKGYSEIK